MARAEATPGQTRRMLLGLAGAAGLVTLLQTRPWQRAGGLVFEPIEGLPGFRRLGPGAAENSRSGQSVATLGQSSPLELSVQASDPLRDRVAGDLETHLFRGVSGLPIAYFTDIFCPICRRVETDLESLWANNPAVRLVVHEHPVFGDKSVQMARILVAADMLGVAPQVRQRLQRGARSSEMPLAAILAALEQDLDLPPGALTELAATPEVTETLRISNALASLFGFFGTPALVIGRTAILGAQPLDVLQEIVAEEAANRP